MLGQEPLAIVHLKIYEPGAIPVTLLVGELGVTITAPPGPPTCVQVPIPIEGVLPAKLKLVAPHKLTGLVVIVATVAGAEAVIITVSLVAIQPAVTKLHSNLYIPSTAPVTVVLADDELVIVGVLGPLTKAQVPVSDPLGAFPPRFKEMVPDDKH